MRKLLALILSAVIVLTLVSCGKKPADTDINDVAEPEQEIIVTDENPAEEKEDKTENKKDNKTEEKPQVTPENKPEVKPETTPEAKPETPDNTAKTPGQTLLADFKAKAASHSTAASLAEALAANPILPFAAGAMPVEPGLLSGFGNTEIKGFKEGAMFAPFIGSIPFVGYVFILEDGVSASSFISTLDSNADLRWNICVEADEKVSGSVGNKVFFVMSPKAFEE